MLDLNTGILRFEMPDGRSVCLGPKAHLDDVIGSSVENVAHMTRNRPTGEYTIRTRIELHGEQFIPTVHFRCSICVAICLTIRLPEVLSWSDFTENTLSEMKRRADQVMVQLTGATKADFAWGTMESSLDVKTGCADVWITYA